MNVKRTLFAFAFVALAVLGMYVFLDTLEDRKEDLKAKKQKDLYASYGMENDGRTPFASLPKMLTHNVPAADLGGRLFCEKRLAAVRSRMCVACHSPGEGGTDSKMHSGLLTRPVCNAAFSTVFMNDGSVSNLAGAVRIMIEDSRFSGGPPVSSLVAVFSADEAMLRRFQLAYEDGVTETNILDSIVQYHKTLVTPHTRFDRFASGATNVYDAAEMKGSQLFKSLNCVSCHDGPVLGGRKTHDGVKVPALRGLSSRKVYRPLGSGDLGAVLSRMPCGELEKEDRVALVKFLKTL